MRAVIYAKRIEVDYRTGRRFTCTFKVVLGLCRLSIASVVFTWETTLKKNYGTHVIKLDIAPVAYPLGQHLFISASNNMFYRHSQWDKRHTICVVNLMPQDTKIEFLNRSCLGLNLQSSVWVSDTLPLCHICLVQILGNWIYLELNICLAFIQPVF